MKIGFVLFDGMTSLDFIGPYDALTRLRSMSLLPDVSWDLAAWSEPVTDSQGLVLHPTCLRPPLGEFDLVLVPGGPGTRQLLKDADFLAWLRTAAQAAQIASVCSGALLLAAAGLLEGRSAATHPNARRELAELGVAVIEARLVEDGPVLSSGGVSAGIDLGLALVARLAGPAAAEKVRLQMDYPLPLAPIYRPGSSTQAPRQARITRKTGETSIELSLNLDGRGVHRVQTGVPFLDHMLVQVAVHGLFDLSLQASGDLEVDPHHTVEDVALALGQAFREALGNKAGIQRMASFEVPMDESLARVTLDFSGRPYAVVEATWHTPAIGALPVSLIPHFLESFAIQAGCNLHARVFYGRDDHHQAEALFKALGRALEAATRIDPRRAGAIPSSKGVL